METGRCIITAWFTTVETVITAVLNSLVKVASKLDAIVPSAVPDWVGTAKTEKGKMLADGHGARPIQKRWPRSSSTGKSETQKPCFVMPDVAEYCSNMALPMQSTSGCWTNKVAAAKYATHVQLQGNTFPSTTVMQPTKYAGYYATTATVDWERSAIESICYNRQFCI